jgi:hypothetical protein
MDLLLYPDSNLYVVQTAHSARVLGRHAQASDALEQALGLIPTEGGTIELASGRYALARPLQLRPLVVIRGRGTATVLQAAPGFSGKALIRGERCHRASLIDLTLLGGTADSPGTGVSVIATGELRLVGVTAARFSATGFYLGGSCFMAHLDRCVAAFCGQHGFRLHKLERGEFGDFLPSLLTSCYAYGGGVGFQLDHALVINLVGCVAFQTSGAGFWLTRESNSVAITGCRTFQVSGDAFRCDAAHELNVTGNIFCWHTGSGLVIRGCRWGVISGNNIIDNGSWNSGTADVSTPFSELPKDFENQNGITLEDVRGFSVTGNAIFNWPVCPPMKHGVYEDARCADNIIAANNVNLHEAAAALVNGIDSTQVANLGRARPSHIQVSDHYFGSADPAGIPLQSFPPDRMPSYLAQVLGQL